MKTVTTTFTVWRNGEDLDVRISGTYYPATIGRRANKWDRFAEPDDCAEIVDITANDQEGNVIDITEEEEDSARERLFEAEAADWQDEMDTRAEMRRDDSKP